MEQTEKKLIFLSNLFQHLDGIVLIPTILELQTHQILDYIKSQKKCALSELTHKYHANPGYLNVALRLLCSQGILTQKIEEDDIFFIDSMLTNWMSLKIESKYQMIEELYRKEINYKSIITDTKNSNISEPHLYAILEEYIKWKKLDDQKNKSEGMPINDKWANWRIHIEGAVLGPIIVLLSRNNVFDGIVKGSTIEIPGHPKWKEILIKLFLSCNIINEDSALTEYGYFLLKRATSYGVTVSYLPTFKSLNHLIYGNHRFLTTKSKKEAEIHVDRAMNVWGSGGAHNTYFKKVDKIILDLFNLPIEEQPKGFIDIGCGNGKLIEHVFDLIYYKTKRGQLLKEHPLFIVGSDFNYQALEATTETINKADIWAKTAFGDISDPASLAKRLKEEHSINLVDLLNVRSFLDHNRIYESPKKENKDKSASTGAFCYQGSRLQNNAVEQNLKEHLQKWYPYLTKYGLLIVELHTIDPVISAKNIGKTAITAYDASHGFSDQYIIEYNLFLKKALEIGLVPDPSHEYTFPSKEIPIVSINRLIATNPKYD